MVNVYLCLETIMPDNEIKNEIVEARTDTVCVFQSTACVAPQHAGWAPTISQRLKCQHLLGVLTCRCSPKASAILVPRRVSMYVSANIEIANNDVHIHTGGTMSDSQDQVAEKISSGRTSLGIEFGSTRIKAVLIDGLQNVDINIITTKGAQHMSYVPLKAHTGISYGDNYW